MEPALSRGRIRPLASLIAVVAALTLVATGTGAQQPRRPYRIGVLHEGWAANHPTVLGLKQGLKELGLEEGRDVAFDIRFTQGNRNITLQLASTMAAEALDMIFTSGESAMQAAFDASPRIPIVFTRVGPNTRANITGVSSLSIKLGPKRLEVLKTLAPTLRRVWVIYPAADATALAGVQELEKAASRLKLEIVARPVWSAEEVARLLGAARPGDGLLAPENDTFDIPATILETSLRSHLPAVFPTELWVRHGGLVSYGPDYQAQGLQAARLVVKVLQGARPEDLPIEGADRINLAVNLKTAALLGMNVPRKVLLRAEMVHR